VNEIGTMVFALKVDLSVSFPIFEGDLTTMEEAFYRLQNKEGVEHKERQLQAQERSQIMAEAPALWNQLVRSVSMEVAEFSNLRPGYLSMTDQSQSTAFPFFGVSITGTNHKIEVIFSPEAPRINFKAQGALQGTQKEGTYSFKLSGGEVMLHDEHNQRFAVPDVASSLLNNLL
jgi:hypothetical protein